MKQGGEHWEWNADIPFYLGVLPRRGAKGSDIKVSSLERSQPLLYEFFRTMFSRISLHSGSERRMHSLDTLPTHMRQLMGKLSLTFP